jgi:hypothetical protein
LQSAIKRRDEIAAEKGGTRKNTHTRHICRIALLARLVLWLCVLFRVAALVATCLGFVAPATLGDEVVRIMAANTSSGNNQSYDPGHGNRIFQGLDPDIALVQEMNVTLNGSKNSAATYRQWVNENFGSTFFYHVETGKSIPNGIVSRYPFLATGVWEDEEMPDREFVWARIDLPGDMNLLAISVHLSSGGGSSTRNTQAGNLRSLIQANKLASDHVVIGGDFNTDTRSESCLSTLSSVVVTASPWPVDQSGVGGTNASRAKPYDWVAAGSSLAALSTPLVIGSNTFTNGIVFDSRVYSPLSAVSPVLSADSGATNMQHMAVMRAFLIPTNDPPVITQGPSVAVTLSANNSPTAFSRSLNATDADGNPLSWSIQTAAAHGTAGITAPASGGSVNLSYQPTLNYTGSDSFVVRVSDGQGGTDSITVNLTVQAPPPPIVSGGGTVSFSMYADDPPLSYVVSATAGTADPLQWSLPTAPAHGGVVLTAFTSGQGVSVLYTPTSGYLGTDTFTFRATDVFGGTASKVVNITIVERPNHAPVITEGSSLGVSLSKNNSPLAFAASLAATDSDNDTLAWSISTPAGHGTASIAAPASGPAIELGYSPEPNYIGSDSFTVTVSDGRGGSDTILVNLTIVEPPNTAPVIAGAEQRHLTISQNGYPAAFQLTLDAEDGELDPLAWSISAAAANGTASVEGSDGHAAILYQPAGGFTGEDSFTVEVADGRGGMDSVAVQVSVEAAAAIDAWTYATFQPLDPAEEATVWGEAADPDEDGYTNLEEFAHGLDPKVGDAAPNLLSLMSGESGDEAHVVLSFKMRMDGDEPALDYGLRATDGPGGAWVELLPEDYMVLGELDPGGGFRVRSVRVPVSEGQERRFYRLEFKRMTGP